MAKSDSTKRGDVGGKEAASAKGANEGATRVFGFHLPPATASIPRVPPTFVPVPNRGAGPILPQKAEIANLAGALADLRALTDYTVLFGTAGASHEEAIATFTAAEAWTRMQVEMDAWGAYCAVQQESIWRMMRKLMKVLGPTIEQAHDRDPDFIMRVPKLTFFLRERKKVAEKATATKAANKQAVLAGEAPTHGVVGKKRKSRAAKAALEKVTAGGREPT